MRKELNLKFISAFYVASIKLILDRRSSVSQQLKPIDVYGLLIYFILLFVL